MRFISAGKYRVYIENENRFGRIRNAVVGENSATTNRLAIHTQELTLIVLFIVRSQRCIDNADKTLSRIFMHLLCRLDYLLCI